MHPPVSSALTSISSALRADLNRVFAWLSRSCFVSHGRLAHGHDAAQAHGALRDPADGDPLRPCCPGLRTRRGGDQRALPLAMPARGHPWASALEHACAHAHARVPAHAGLHAKSTFQGGVLPAHARMLERARRSSNHVICCYQACSLSRELGSVLRLGCVVAAQTRKVWHLLGDMQGRGLQPDKHTFTTALSACAEANQLNRALSLIERMYAIEVQPDVA
eukprot:3477497-Pleurochrysis_carterae.AAC.1